MWPHQREAVDKVCRELGSDTTEFCARATVVAACGTGKTRIAAESSRRLAAHGRVLVFVPTLELLAQAAHTYAAHLGAAAGVITAVCGDAQVTESASSLRAEMADQEAPVSTDPGELARILRQRGRLTVFATYASLPVILAAHAEFCAPRWDLVIVDEAHRTAGCRGRWSRVHDDRLLPPARRLYLTATPRIMTTGGADLVSMDDTSVFGRQVFTLSFATAIDAGLLADYRVAVVTVTDAEIAKLTAPHNIVSVGGRPVDARTLAMQIVLAKAIREYRLRRVITYHGRVAAATRFAAGLSEVVDLLPLADRPAYPVRARWIAGGVRPEIRRKTLSALRNPGDAAVVVANARVLAEGVDIPALDAVMFADPRSSATDVVQAVGRALRRGDDAGKTATVIVPIFLTEGENPQAALCGSEFDTVWRVLRALRAHDERIADHLDRQRRRGGAGRDLDSAPQWLRINGTPAQIGDDLHRAIMVRTIETTTSPWWESFGALARFHAEHHHLNVPSTVRTPRGVTLGPWLADCRRTYRAGALQADRVAALASLDFEWSPRRGWERGITELRNYVGEHDNAEVPHSWATTNGYALGAWLGIQRRRLRDGALSAREFAELHALGVDVHNRRRRDPKHEAAWAENISAAQSFRALHEHLDIPVDYHHPDGRRLGKWLQHCREYHAAGTLPPERAAQLEELGIDWAPARSQWNRALNALRTFYHEHGHSHVVQTHVTGDGFHLGTWLRIQRGRYRSGTLAPARIAELEALAVDWQPAESRWTAGLAALADYRRTHGELHIPQRYVTDSGFRLGSWLSTRRKEYRTGRLSPQRFQQLAELGVTLAR